MHVNGKLIRLINRQGTRKKSLADSEKEFTQMTDKGHLKIIKQLREITGSQTEIGRKCWKT